MLLDQLVQRPFCIYGAGIVATSVYTAIKTLYRRTPLFFLISDPEDTREKQKQENDDLWGIDGLPVKSLSEWQCELQKKEQQNYQKYQKAELEQTSDSSASMVYLVAVPEVHHLSIITALRTLQVEDENIYLFTNRRENDLMEAYYGDMANCHTVKDIISERKKQGWIDGREHSAKWSPTDGIHVYQAKSHMDKPLHDQHGLSCTPSYIFPIQVGANLTDQIIAGLQDNIGDNISDKNRNYCELTATYYAWKHSSAPYKGICHYRRIFDISDMKMQELLAVQEEWDVILPYPSVHYPDISAQHSRYVKEKDWNVMVQALEELAPEYLEAYKRSILSGERFFHNYNMLIARAPIFDDYCDFLFKILERTEELVTPRGWERADRFAGYLGENLTTLYFLKNRERWKIAYTGKIWLT